MKRRIFSYILVALAAFMLNPVYSHTKEYTSKNELFSFKYFKNWKVSDRDGRVTVFAPAEGPKDTQSENWGITIAPTNGLSLEESYKRYIIDAFPNTFDNFKVIEEGKGNHNGIPSLWIKYSFKEGNQNVANLTTLLVHENQLFILIGYCLLDDFEEKYSEEFSTMMNSFRIN